MEKDAHKGKRKPWTLREFGGKTFWDWLQLLIVPVVLSLITVVFAWQQDNRQNQIEKKRTQQAQKIENKRANAERELARERAQDEALQAYLDQMSDLLLAKDGLRESKEGSEVRTLARARTITVLERLDPSRRSAILQFLVEANLVQGVGERAPIITLSGANLHGTILSEANLRGAELRDADLRGATLFAANLSDANLYRAYLNDARMPWTNLSGANLIYANLSGANLANADLNGANLANASLNDADLGNASLNDADLSLTDLSGADLTKEQRQEAKTDYKNLWVGGPPPRGPRESEPTFPRP